MGFSTSTYGCDGQVCFGNIEYLGKNAKRKDIVSCGLPAP